MSLIYVPFVTRLTWTHSVSHFIKLTHIAVVEKMSIKNFSSDFLCFNIIWRMWKKVWKYLIFNGYSKFQVYHIQTLSNFRTFFSNSQILFLINKRLKCVTNHPNKHTQSTEGWARSVNNHNFIYLLTCLTKGTKLELCLVQLSSNQMRHVSATNRRSETNACKSQYLVFA